MTRKSESDKQRLVSVMVHNCLLSSFGRGPIPLRGTMSVSSNAQGFGFLTR